MKRKFKQKIKLGIIIITSSLNTSAALANNIESIPSVSKIKNIHTRDWEYRALKSLAQRYNCTSQWQSDETFSPLRDWRSHAKGDRRNLPITRYEFAVGLNSCLQQIDTITSQQDLIILQRLQQDFTQELARLTTKVEQLETNITQLESEQFSTTTKFNGQALFFLTDSFGQENNSQTTFGYRTRLIFDTSFSGQDLLRVRLENRDLPRLDDVTDTSLSRLGVDGDTDDLTEISELSYTFPAGENTEILFGTAGVSLNDVGEVLNPFSSSSSGAVSRFGRRDPATLRAPGGSGIGIKQEFSDKILGFAGYFINDRDVADPQAGRGLFDSSYSAIAQLVIEPKDELTLAATYTRTYERNDDVNLMGSTGVEEANEPFGQNATASDNFGLQANWEVTSGLEIGGWFGYTQAQQQQNGDASATILNGALTFAFPDLWAENNVGGIIIGVPPVISGHDDDDLVTEETPLHIEALYRVKVSDYIEITPGGFVVINPDTENGNTLWVGTVRTEFSF
ncbi:porin [Pleurocapsa sp. CCALA 161]|uniref:iron uptake porin n=1 Tax=Pleurocapsa sp. CCALA 161 TaxID=2107688 RepID=UPI000D059C32|nr:iron uptake porin [Pleurocapsa sp. CCALA 161]PSB08605.1 porin [Pleurocapsa sp. CCALA 161]